MRPRLDSSSLLSLLFLVIFANLFLHLLALQPLSPASPFSIDNNSNNKFRQRNFICSEQETNLFPTWCRYQNPFTIPFLFSDIEYPEETRQAVCDGDQPLSDCTNVINIIVHEFQMFTSRFISFALRSGKIIVTGFNTPYITNIVNATIGPVQHFSSVSIWNGGYLASASERQVSYYMGLVTDEEPFRHCYIETLPQNEKIIEIKFFKDTLDQPYFSLLSYNSVTKSYTLRFSEQQGCSQPPTEITKWEIAVSSPENNVPKYYIFHHKENITEGITTLSGNVNRTLLLLHDRYQVKIFDLNLRKNISIEFDKNKYDRATFYQIEDDAFEITAATVILEKMRRVDVSKSTCANVVGNTAENVHLAVTRWNEDTYESQLAVRLIPEFGMYIAPESDMCRDPFNPAGRADDFNCVNGYQEVTTKVCMKARQYIRDLDSKVTAIVERYIDLPSEVNGVRKYIDGLLNLEIMCELLSTKYPHLYKPCIDLFANGSSICELELIKQVDSLVITEILKRFMYSNLFMMTDQKKVIVYGAQMILNTKDELIVEMFNEIPFVGNLRNIEVSPNGQHMFATVTRKKFELDSMQRYLHICKEYKKDPDNIFLKPYADSCRENPGRPVDLNQYAQYSSSCMPGSYCPSLIDTQLQKVPEGFYTMRPNTKIECEPKYFCNSGIRSDCPIGFICPNKGMTRPLPCPPDPDGVATCFAKNLLEPQVAPQGTLTLAPYFPPMPVSPGYYMTEDRDIHSCKLGEYCPLGRYSPANDTQTLLCPEFTYCPSPDSLYPIICNCSEKACSYCPAGQYEEKLCPAGFYCMKPNQKQECSKTYYCNNGTTIPRTCPAGYYCPTPDEIAICPYGYFCKEGSVKPARCTLLSICNEGTSDEKTNFVGLVVDISIVIAIISLYQIYLRIRDRVRKRDQKQRAALVQELKALLSFQNIEVQDENLQSVPQSPQHDILSITSPMLSPVSSAPASRYKIDLRFENLGLVLKKGGHRILESVTGEIKSGTLCAVMGLSGSGKSTFITALSGRAHYGNVLGKIYVNGKEANLANFKKIVGFVPQEDIMIRTMTVEETLYFSARARLDEWTTSAEIQQKVEKVIHMLGLDDIRYSIIGDENNRGISGGQRKRVNIGMELVADPCVLFLDEPTSGLDSSSSREVCTALKAIARTGITVVTVIHQPRYEIFKMFTKVMLLGKGGRICYFGASEKAVDYFSSIGFDCPPQVNPPDFLMDVINGDIPRKNSQSFKPSDLFKLWEERQEAVEEAWEIVSNDGLEESTAATYSVASTAGLSLEEESKSRNSSFIMQCWMCIKRSITQNYIRDLSGFFLDQFLLYLSGLFLGMIFFTQTYVGPVPKPVIDLCPGPLKFICTLPLDDPIINQASLMPLTLGLTAVMASLPTFGPEEAVYQREAASGISPLAYFIGKNVAHLPNIIIAPIIFLSIFFTLSSAVRGSPLEYYYILVLLHFTAYGFGYLISIVIRTSMAQLVGVVAVMVCSLFSGARPTLPQLQKMFFPIPLIPYLSYIRYGQEALYLTEIKWYKDIYDVKPGMELFSYDESHLAWCIIMVPVFGIAFRVLAYIALLCKRHDSYFNTVRNQVADFRKIFSKIFGCISYVATKLFISKRQVRSTYTQIEEQEEENPSAEGQGYQQQESTATLESVDISRQ